ncbi:hypothetical protein C4579_02620, partial [Candidatus Microgenomates bacterium]
FTYWYLLSAPLVAGVLIWLWRKNLALRFVAVVLFLSLVVTGGLELTRLLQTNRTQIRLWNAQDIELSQQIRQKTDPKGVFLTAAVHDHPAVALAGRKTLLGYPGTIWSWGIAGWDIRERDVHTMFRGGEGAKRLWKKYDVGYIIISNRERGFEPELDEEIIASQSELVLEQGSTKVYQVIH